jgi:hypothetical protein
MQRGWAARGRGTTAFVVGCVAILAAIEVGMRASSDHVVAPPAAAPSAVVTTTTTIDMRAIALEITELRQKVAGLMREKVDLEHQIRVDAEEARRARNNWLDAAADAAEARQATARERIAELTRDIDVAKNEIAARNQAAVLARPDRRPPAGAAAPAP